MKLAITSIQRNRGKWIVEWLAFHMLVGFEQFYLYAHKTDDGMTETLVKLARRYDIKVHQLGDQPQPQLLAYQHAYAAYGESADWMAFIDGDEFLYPTACGHMAEALAAFDATAMSALAVNWRCYGSNGHVVDPDGLVMQDYPRHSRADFLPNRHVKSIMRGGQTMQVRGAHLFDTALGTFDTLGRPVTQGWMFENPATYEVLRINHYAVQSFDFFRRTKQNIGAADGNPNLIRPDTWFHELDRNDEDDGQSYQFLARLKLKTLELLDTL
jgi:hypothetical protein